jgi:pectate lyase
MAQNLIRVPQGCPTVQKAMALAVIFSERKEYTEAEPLKIRLDEGVHQIVGGYSGKMNVTCSHITFVGKGKAQTTILGGFYVRNQQNVKFEELAITNGRCGGLLLKGSETTLLTC